MAPKFNLVDRRLRELPPHGGLQPRRARHPIRLEAGDSLVKICEIQILRRKQPRRSQPVEECRDLEICSIQSVDLERSVHERSRPRPQIRSPFRICECGHIACRVRRCQRSEQTALARQRQRRLGSPAFEGDCAYCLLTGLQRRFGQRLKPSPRAFRRLRILEETFQTS